jgi:putative membrane protein
MPEDRIGNENKQVDEKTDLATARTVLAVERTFSTWMRLGIAFLAGGIALAKVMSIEALSGLHDWLITGASGLLILLAALIAGYAAWRYRDRMRHVGSHTLGRWPVGVIFFIGLSFIAVCAVGILCVALL